MLGVSLVRAAERRVGERRRYVAHVYRDRGDIAGCAIGILDLDTDGRGSRAITEGDVEAACSGSAIEDQVGYRAYSATAGGYHTEGIDTRVRGREGVVLGVSLV